MNNLLKPIVVGSAMLATLESAECPKKHNDNPDTHCETEQQINFANQQNSIYNPLAELILKTWDKR